MVFFVCEGCNESLKKSQVDSHASRCSSCHSVTCVDCNITFPGDTYRSHTSCVSEAERYERTVYRGVKKGDERKSGKKIKLNPQEIWNNLIMEASERKSDAPSSIHCHLDTLTSCSNVPRKEKQFRNFASNSLRLRSNDVSVGLVWDFLSKLREEKNEVKAKEKEDKEREEEERKKETEEKQQKEKEQKETKEDKEDNESKDSLEKNSVAPLSKKRKATDSVSPSTVSPLNSPSKKCSTKILKGLLKKERSIRVSDLKKGAVVVLLEKGYDVSASWWREGFGEVLEGKKFKVVEGEVSLT